MRSFVVAVALLAGISGVALAADKAPATQPAKGDKYVCPMACATADKPGKCPKCGMDLVKAKADEGKKTGHEGHHH